MTNPKHSLGDPGELAALYTAGAMTPEESAAFVAHLEEGCPACAAELRALDDTAARLAGGVSQTPPARVRETLLERVAQSAYVNSSPSPAKQVWREWTADTQEGLFIKRAGEGAWEETGVAGVRVRRLFVDRPRNEMTMLVRMDPGSAYPRHVHDGPEQCLVLEGDLHVEGTVMLPGDYQRAAPGSLHGVQSTQGGCLLLVTSSLTDELV